MARGDLGDDAAEARVGGGLGGDHVARGSAPPSRTAAQVSSQEVSIASSMVRPSAGHVSPATSVQPHDQRVLAVVVVVAGTDAGGAEAEAFVHADRAVVGDAHLERERQLAARPPRSGRRSSCAGDAAAAVVGGDGDVHQVPDLVVAGADDVASQLVAARWRRGRSREGLESSSTNIASDQGVGKERRSIEITAGRSL